MESSGSSPDYISVRNHHYKKADIEAITLIAWVQSPSRGMIASWDRSEFFRFGVGDDQLGNNDFIAFDTCCGIHDWHGKEKITDDKWHHVVAQFDGKNKRIYVDGKLDAEVKAPHKVMGKVITRYGFIGIGSEAGAFDGGIGPNWAFRGVMDEFFLFHRAVTAKEIAHMAKGPSEPFAVDSKLSVGPRSRPSNNFVQHPEGERSVEDCGETSIVCFPNFSSLELVVHCGILTLIHLMISL